MNDPQTPQQPGDPPFETDSLNALNVVVEGPGDTTVRPITPEDIAAIKRYWERQGRRPPPPWDKV